ncbi:MAG: hypothetical protein H6729_10015 [Deltaproteobacteria bacterium]|nr:hypothetical protein [Deltaproteobacteria bacterium]
MLSRLAPEFREAADATTAKQELEVLLDRLHTEDSALRRLMEDWIQEGTDPSFPVDAFKAQASGVLKEFKRVLESTNARLKKAVAHGEYSEEVLDRCSELYGAVLSESSDMLTRSTPPAQRLTGGGARLALGDFERLSSAVHGDGHPTLPLQSKAGWRRIDYVYPKKTITRGRARPSGDQVRGPGHVLETVRDGVNVQVWPAEHNVPLALHGLVEIRTSGEGVSTIRSLFRAAEQQLGIVLQGTEARRERHSREGTRADLIAPTPAHVWRSEVDPSGSEWEGFCKRFALLHDLKCRNESSLEDIIRSIIEGSGTLAPATERMRLGQTCDSPFERIDLNTGAANYIFLRITPRDQRRLGVFYSPAHLLRADAISYPRDLYGATDPETRRANERSGLLGWEECAASWDNETLLRGPLDFFDGLDQIVCATNDERARVIATLKTHGYETLPDGRTPEDVVVWAHQGGSG